MVGIRRCNPAVSIHAPRAGRDPGDELRLTYWVFQSTRPVRGATVAEIYGAKSFSVSIHAPRAGRDLALVSSLTSQPVFQSTRPVRGATQESR